MDVTQVRIPNKLLEESQKLIDKGFYTNKSDVIRDALRKLILEYHIGSIPKQADSVKQIKLARKQLSEKVRSFEDLQ